MRTYLNMYICTQIETKENEIIYDMAPFKWSHIDDETISVVDLLAGLLHTPIYKAEAHGS